MRNVALVGIIHGSAGTLDQISENPTILWLIAITMRRRFPKFRGKINELGTGIDLLHTVTRRAFESRDSLFDLHSAKESAGPHSGENFVVPLRASGGDVALECGYAAGRHFWRVVS